MDTIGICCDMRYIKPNRLSSLAAGLSLAAAFTILARNGLAAEPSSATPVVSMLDRFTAADVPTVGPEELPGDPPRWLVSTNETDPTFPGGGLRRHPLLYIGEGCNTTFLVNDGKVIWTCSTGKGGEYDDIWLMSNGNILFSRMGWAGELTPQKKQVVEYDRYFKEIWSYQIKTPWAAIRLHNGKTL